MNGKKIVWARATLGGDLKSVNDLADKGYSPVAALPDAWNGVVVFVMVNNDIAAEPAEPDKMAA